MTKEDLHKKDVVYYAHIIPKLGVFDLCEIIVRTIEDNYFVGIDKARFKQKVLPGDVLMLETRIIKVKGPIGVGEATATVDGKVVCKAKLTFAIG